MNDQSTSQLLIIQAKMTQSVRTQVASTTLARLEHQHLNSQSVHHAFVGQTEQPVLQDPILSQSDEVQLNLNVNQDMAAVEDDNAMLTLLVQDKIDCIKAKIPKIKKKFEQLNLKIISDLFKPNSVNNVYFVFASAQEHTRAFVMIIEDVTVIKKFPLEKMKDIARVSFFLEEPKHLISFFNQFKGEVENVQELRLIQIKNMFTEGCQQQQEIKMIVGQESDGRVQPVEFQFLLRSIGDAKQALHYFQDITRADFIAMQARKLIIKT